MNVCFLNWSLCLMVRTLATIVERTKLKIYVVGGEIALANKVCCVLQLWFVKEQVGFP